MLAEMQKQFAAALLGGSAPTIQFAKGPIGAADAFQVHRNTVLGAGVNALRLTFPTVAQLLGERFFDRCAARFVEQHPPRAPHLSAYGEYFPAFLASGEGARDLSYLGDVARLDWSLNAVLRAPQTRRRFVLDDAVALDLPSHLHLLDMTHDACGIRAAVESGDDVLLAAADISAGRHAAAVWRDGRSARLRSLRFESLNFLKALYAGAAPDAALAQAGEAAAVIAAIQADIFPASFCQIVPREETPA